MDKTTIQTLIDKVIGKRGLIRVPNWWMRKVLIQMADWVQEGDAANSEKIVKINKDITKLLNLTLPYILVSGTGIVNIDGNEISFTDADKQLIYITGAIKFKRKDGAQNNKLTYIYIPHLDIRSQGRDMSYMFYNCSALTSIDLTGFNTLTISDMSYMFYSCQNLTSLDLSGFDTSMVTNMESMFFSCDNLTSLILGPNFFKTSNVTSINFRTLLRWTNETVITSLVTNSYDRATAGLNVMILQLHANTKAALTDEQKATITSKGYTIA